MKGLITIMLEIGIKGIQFITVSETETAAIVGSGELQVFATPSMIALMEATASASVKPFIELGTTTVGTLVNVRHLSATPIGMNIRCESELVEIDRKRLVFSVKALDNSGLIGEGTHERFIVTIDKFMSQAEKKRGD